MQLEHLELLEALKAAGGAGDARASPQLELLERGVDAAQACVGQPPLLAPHRAVHSDGQLAHGAQRTGARVADAHLVLQVDDDAVGEVRQVTVGHTAHLRGLDGVVAPRLPMRVRRRLGREVGRARAREGGVPAAHPAHARALVQPRRVGHRVTQVAAAHAQHVAVQQRQVRHHLLRAAEARGGWRGRARRRARARHFGQRALALLQECHAAAAAARRAPRARERAPPWRVCAPGFITRAPREVCLSQAQLLGRLKGVTNRRAQIFLCVLRTPVVSCDTLFVIVLTA